MSTRNNNYHNIYNFVTYDDDIDDDAIANRAELLSGIAWEDPNRWPATNMNNNQQFGKAIGGNMASDEEFDHCFNSPSSS